MVGFVRDKCHVPINQIWHAVEGHVKQLHSRSNVNTANSFRIFWFFTNIFSVHVVKYISNDTNEFRQRKPWKQFFFFKCTNAYKDSGRDDEGIACTSTIRRILERERQTEQETNKNANPWRGNLPLLERYNVHSKMHNICLRCAIYDTEIKWDKWC